MTTETFMKWCLACCEEGVRKARDGHKKLTLAGARAVARDVAVRSPLRLIAWHDEQLDAAAHAFKAGYAAELLGDPPER